MDSCEAALPRHPPYLLQEMASCPAGLYPATGAWQHKAQLFSPKSNNSEGALPASELSPVAASSSYA